MKRLITDFPFFASHVKGVVRDMDPLEVLFLAVFLMSGIFQSITGARPGSIDVVMPETFRLLWLLMLTLGSAIALIGIFWRGDRVTAMITESVGLAWVSLSLIIYGAAAIVATSLTDQPTSGTLGGPLIIVLGIAFGWKHRRIQRLVNRLKT
jgi:hypothetical protein